MTNPHHLTNATSNNPLFQRFLFVANKLFVWLLFFSIIYLLRSFFPLILLTFVFAYIQTQTVNHLQSYIKNRLTRVILVAFCFLAVWVAVGTYLIPATLAQTKLFANNYTTYLQTFDNHLLQFGNQYPRVKNFIPAEWPNGQTTEETTWSPSASISIKFIQTLFDMKTPTLNHDPLKTFIDILQKFVLKTVAIISAFLLALLFSFLIVLDLPHLTNALLDLKNTKLKFFYTEVYKSIFSFGNTLGRTLEAQFLIAVINTILTAFGLLLLGLKAKIAFLSVIVFVFSFIPIVGVFISSGPICLVALQNGGVSLMFFAILLITIIHLIEAYILSPKIYGHHLHMNPVLVLIVLMIAGKLFGIWGLILALPVCRYIFGEAIRS